tara:strand:+ start:597 stop:746 length:150 start_codon:yes stop_codon:yes gene_type:complete
LTTDPSAGIIYNMENTTTLIPSLAFCLSVFAVGMIIGSAYYDIFLKEKK